MLFLFVLALLLPSQARADNYDRIQVNVVSATHITVDGKRVSLDEVPAAFRALVRDNLIPMAVIYFRLPENYPLRKQVMAKCKEGGAKAFSICYKS